ncbi:MAG: exonuclease domain-containing protein [Ktedonobacteraceae bacterium]|nr:exonuclease domain-containing protein [Ktedonobacteraceae bacterium]
MSKRIDQIIVVDVESTCWEGASPVGQESEIIEIGVCPLDIASGQRLGRYSMLVRPERSTVSPFCTRLTTLTQEQVDSGISFTEACAWLEDTFASRQRVWASFGDYDRRQFERLCASHGINSPFGTRHLNVKTLFAIWQALSSEVDLDQALQLSHLSFEGTHHRGNDDAWNIAFLLSRLVLQLRST